MPGGVTFLGAVGPLAVFGALAAMAAWLVADSALALRRFSVGANARDVAAVLEQGARPTFDRLQNWIENDGLDAHAGECGDITSRAMVTIGLVAVDQAAVTNDPAKIDAAELRALEILKRRLVCSPLDGNAWLRYAIVDTLVGGPTARVVRSLLLSYWSTPSESWILEARLPFVMKLQLAGVSGLESVYAGDLRHFASFESAEQVAKLYVDAAAAVKVELKTVILEQPTEREKAIAAEVDRLGELIEAPAPIDPL